MKVGYSLKEKRKKKPLHPLVFISFTQCFCQSLVTSNKSLSSDTLCHKQGLVNYTKI